jgi:hypothetical protein
MKLKMEGENKLARASFITICLDYSDDFEHYPPNERSGPDPEEKGANFAGSIILFMLQAEGWED